MSTTTPHQPETPATGAHSDDGLTVERLELLADQLLLGKISLHDLPPALATFYHLGSFEAREIAEQAIRHVEYTAGQKIRDLEHENDRLYLAATNPKERVQMLQQRLDDYYERMSFDDIEEPALPTTPMPYSDAPTPPEVVRSHTPTPEGPNQ